MQIAIIDDSKEDQEMILDYLSKFFNEKNEEYSTTLFDDAITFLDEYSYAFDFIIFDIDMPSLSGIDAAKKLREMDGRVTIMFVTNMPQYALEGYSVEAVDYVLKPLSYPDFRLKMMKAEKYIIRNSSKKITINSTDEGLITVESSDVTYIESRLHYIYYHTNKGIYKMRAKLSDHLQMLLSKKITSFIVLAICLQKIRKHCKPDKGGIILEWRI